MLTYTLDQLRASVGQEIAAGDWTTVSQEQIDLFAAATGDRQWIHVDAERAARESPYGTTIAHGFLTLALLSRLSREAFEIAGDWRMRINYGLNRVRFPTPVLAGSRVRARFAVACVEEVERGVQLTLAVTVEVEGSSKPALVAEWLVRLYG